MARPRKDPAIQPPSHLQGGDGEEGREMPAEGHKRPSTRAPTVPFQMVTRRRGAQARTSGGSDEPAVPAEELTSATPAAVVNDDSDYEPPAGSSEAPTEEPRRSSRAPPKRAPQGGKKSLVVTLRVRPSELRRFVTPSVEPLERPAGDLSPVARSKRAKPAVVDEPAQPLSPAPPTVVAAVAATEEAPAESPVPRQKRSRKPREPAPSMEVAGAEDPANPQQEERPVKRRRKAIKSDALIRDESPESPTLAASEQAAAVDPPTSAATPAPGDLLGNSVPAHPTEVVDETEHRVTQEETGRVQAPTPDEPQQKRRGRPPKAELLRRRLNKQMAAANPVVPPPPPAPGPLVTEFRAKMPPGLQMAEVISLAKHMRDKAMLAKRKPMKRCIKRGFRVEHRVTREWCTQRKRDLSGQQTKLDRQIRRANVGLVDQTMQLVQDCEDYLSEKGPASPFWAEGIFVARGHSAKLSAQAAFRRDLDAKRMEQNREREEYLRRRQFANDVAANMERLRMKQVRLSEVVVAFSRDHPDEVDALIQQCESDGKDANTVLLAAALKAGNIDVEAEMAKIDGARGFGLVEPLYFSDDDTDKMDIEEAVPPTPREPTPLEIQESYERGAADLDALIKYANQELQAMKEKAQQEQSLNILAAVATEQDRVPKRMRSEEPVFLSKPSEEPMPTIPEPEDTRIPTQSASPPPRFGSSRSSSRILEEPIEPGFALSGPAPPPDVLKPSTLHQEPELRSRFTGSGDSRRWTDTRMFSVIERPVFSPLQTHHHFLPGVSPPPPLLGSSVPPLPPPSAMSSPGRMLPSPIPTTRFPAAYQAISGRSPSPSVFNPPHPYDPRPRGDQGR
ncbi:hypothetical protein Dda_0135 [Drechslerella dactyloides]|uniref:Uncharacterized protein n=1 Tax=Drechslerella dactyloides TaxID=74499 RepID=A0AAD6NLN1_DREDA|nr:hypothetical protein Dda_0135 [Drechslerella dactyloides]